MAIVFVLLVKPLVLFFLLQLALQQVAKLLSGKGDSGFFFRAMPERMSGEIYVKAVAS